MPTTDTEPSPAARLETLAQEALQTSKKARRNNKSLSGDNYYGNKLATLRADATNAFGSLASSSVGDSSAIAELIQAVFAADTDKKSRVGAVQELCYHLRTTWRSAPVPPRGRRPIPAQHLDSSESWIPCYGRPPDERLLHLGLVRCCGSHDEEVDRDLHY